LIPIAYDYLLIQQTILYYYKLQRKILRGTAFIMKFSIVNAMLALGAINGAIASYTGKMTYYNPSVGTGACGWNNADSELVVAISGNLWTASNPNNDPLCGQQIGITYGSKTVYAEVVDKCPSTECDSTHIDVSPAVFTQFADESIGVVDVTWSFTQCSCYPNCGCTGGNACYCKFGVSVHAPCYPNCGCSGGATAMCSR
jgi:hypothetical protein